MRSGSRSLQAAFALLGLAAVVSVVTTSSRATTRPRPRRPLTEAERGMIAGFTQGVISRASPIRVLFAHPIIGGAQVDTAVEPCPFRFHPAIEGVAVWSAPNQIEFRPRQRMPGGQAYTAVLDLRGLAKGRLAVPRFEFGFSTLRPSFEVVVDGLEAAVADAKTQTLTGRFLTADAEDSSAVERALRATHAGQALRIAWTHDPGRRVHPFVVYAVRRREQATVLRLSGDGTPLGASRQQSRDVTVPGVSTFTVDQARAVQEGEQFIEVRFTDPLRQPQDLRGLIQVGDGDDLRFVVSGNIVRVYSAAGWRGRQTVRVASGVRNAGGNRMPEAREVDVQFEVLKPQVRFVGKGVIVPTSAGLAIPIEVVNLRALVVQAMKVPDGTLPQFLQVNDLQGDRELNRVGRVVWEQVVTLDLPKGKEDGWVPVGLDLTRLVAGNPGGLYRLSLSFRRPHVVWTCGTGTENDAGRPTATADFDGEQESSFWDGWETDGQSWGESYAHRDDPCHPWYYRRSHDHDIRAARNVLVSDLGLIAKAGEDDSLLVVATDLRTTTPLTGADVTVQDYQQQVLASAKTDRDGLVRLPVPRKPYLAVVRHGGQVGYLRLDDGAALSLSHFDVAGARAPRGLKGFLYGERGVWRPGDTLHLTFILFDPARRLPGTHPVRFDLVNSRGQLVKTVTRAEAADGFYVFDVATAPDAPTGNYTGRVSVGGATFERVLKIETVMPNRLKIALDFGTDLLRSGKSLAAVLSSAWLHGAAARNLKAEVELALSATPTRFERYADYVFDDPTRRYETERMTLFDGPLDPNGTARIQAAVAAQKVAAGKLLAHVTTRVHEPGGAFSIDRFSIPFSPYDRYVGIRTPRGDKMRGMLLTDVKHELGIVSVDPAGTPGGDGEVDVKLYKVGWQWWWEKGEEELATYAESSVHIPLQQGTVRLEKGTGIWPFEIKYPDWGRYLIVATDRQGGHRTGKVVYMDWPGWAGRARKDAPGGATVLGFAPDKPEYRVGESVVLTLPTPQKGRALVSVESGSRVLRTDWIEATGTETRYSFAATAAMAPNVYAHVTLLQPHGQAGNDLPIRLYGVALVKVVNAETRLQPVVQCAEVLAPEKPAPITVREGSGRPMTYTLALVDEGLLSLTRFATPNPWDHFYAREALAVKTWDVYDFVAGTYGGAMERMLAIGGDEEGARAGVKRANRFPPMVRFLGPFTLEPGGTGTHAVDIPQYVGAVRVMVVAGHAGAFGAAEKSVFVRKPVMVLGTLPRVLGPEETVALPVSVFALEPGIKDVTVTVTASGPLEVAAPATRTVSFQRTGDELVSFQVRTRPAMGIGRVVIRATAGAAHRAEQKIELDVRMPTVRVVEVVGTTVKPGETWTPSVTLPGLAGTNQVTLEVSRIPPLDLGRRLEYLIQYPHGCLEQTISSVFPQLYLGRLLELSAERRSRIEANVRAGLERLKHFQTTDGGFGYWPADVSADDWASSYAGHFVVEAHKSGYLIPPGLLEQWISYQGRRARAWIPRPASLDLAQAYRLYTLSLANAPELGAMNQLRAHAEMSDLARLRLAAAYQLAGQPEGARALTPGGALTVNPYRELSGTYGSDLRDRAMVLEALLILGRTERVGPLAVEISGALSRAEWLSTHETAYALMALARTAGDVKSRSPLSFSYAWNGGATATVSSESPVVQRSVTAKAQPSVPLAFRNTGPMLLYPRLVLSGLPPVGAETSASNGLTLDVAYLSPQDAALDPTVLEQGTSFKARVKVTHSGTRGDYKEVALSHLFPSGWEIHTEHLPAGARTSASFDYQDIRDDRVHTYFDLKAGESKTFDVLLGASYLGTFYLPMVSVEAMYDATINARARGRWVRVVEPGGR